MNLSISVPPQFEAKLRERAEAIGEDVESFVLIALQEKLSSDMDSLAILSSDQWLAAFDDWMRSRTSRNPNVDDSRESIYPDRI